MNDLASWIAIAIGAIGIALTYLTYRSQRGKTRLEYVILTNTKLLPGHLANELQVRHAGYELVDPALSVVRLVNTGDRPIEPEDFETKLVLTLEGANKVASATWTKRRPSDLQPPIQIADNRIEIAPTLINPGDGLQLQILSAGQTDALALSGRVTGLQIAERPSLPYPPGSGAEGEMLPFDRFMWFFVTPAIILSMGGFAASGEGLTATDRTLVLAAAAILAIVLYPLHVHYLVRRRRRWRL